MILSSTSVDIPYCLEMIEEVTEETGLPKEWKEQAKNLLTRGEVFVDWGPDGPQGYISCSVMILPDTQEKVMVERMLFVRKPYRGGTLATDLVNYALKRAKDNGCVALLAGSSLNSNNEAKALYEGMGFKTNLTFRKEL